MKKENELKPVSYTEIVKERTAEKVHGFEDNSEKCKKCKKKDCQHYKSELKDE